jgi:murein L,D-transpeptidase YcbB/YkuD
MPEGASMTSESFDVDVEGAVKAFQRRHGLTDDGIVGRNTVAAMNVPVQGRIDQIKVNLERGRWILRELGDSFVLVNIAGFQVYVVENRETIWTSRVVVGTTFHKTPLFRADMKYLVMNPTWTLPPGILANETLPRLKSDPNYLPDHHMSLLDRSGNRIDPSTVDFNQYSARNFPYVVRQEPGPWNALGQVKFIFPNDHFVFLHDTPSRNLFGREVRTFSHGCIRVENPLDLAEVLLRDQPAWSRSAIDDQITSEDLKTVYLDEPLTTLLLYWTAWVDPAGQLTFYPDVYERDAAILAGLEEDFQFRARPVTPGEGS